MIKKIMSTLSVAALILCLSHNAVASSFTDGMHYGIAPHGLKSTQAGTVIVTNICQTQSATVDAFYNGRSHVGTIYPQGQYGDTLYFDDQTGWSSLDLHVTANDGYGTLLFPNSQHSSTVYEGETIYINCLPNLKSH